MEATIPFNDLSRQEALSSHDLNAAVTEVLESGHFLLGPNVRRFESELTRFLDVSEVVGVASGTDALQLCITAVCRPGDELVAAANAGGYARAAAERSGVAVRYADVDPETLSLSADSVEAAVGPRTKAVVVTHLYGLMGDVQQLRRLCDDRGLVLIEDCAQSIGAVLRDKPAGAFGSLAAFSFYPTKNLGAAGDGGAVACNEQELAAEIRSLAAYGWTEKYQVDRPRGFNSRLDELQAAVLLHKLGSLDDANERRRVIWREYESVAAGRGLRMIGRPDGSFAAHLAVLMTRDRGEAESAFAAGGIGTAIHYPVLDTDQPAWNAPDELPVSRDVVGRILSLPCFPELTDVEVARVCSVLGSL